MDAAPMDPYAVLGVRHGASLLEIARARRRLAKRYHPDLARGEDAALRMAQINAAWAELTDPAGRLAWGVGAARAPHWASQTHDASTRAHDSGAAWAAWSSAPPSRGGAMPAPPGSPSVRESGWLATGLLFVLGVVIVIAGLLWAPSSASEFPDPRPAPWLRNNLDRP